MKKAAIVLVSLALVATMAACTGLGGAGGWGKPSQSTATKYAGMSFNGLIRNHVESTLLREMATQGISDDQVRLLTRVIDNFDWSRLQEAYVQSLLNNANQNELEAAIQFVSSPTGQAIEAKWAHLVIPNLPETVNNADMNNLDPARVGAAQLYVQRIGFWNYLETTVQEMAQAVPEEDRQTYIDVVLAEYKRRNIETVYVYTMAQYYTLEEIEALTAYHGSQNGHTFLLKTGRILADVYPVFVDLVKEEVSKQIQQ